VSYEWNFGDVKIIVGAPVSMDGVMQAPGAATEVPTKGFKFGGWVMPYFDQEFDEELDRVFRKELDLLLGRKTYEIFAAYLPYQDENAPPWRHRQAVQRHQEARGFELREACRRRRAGEHQKRFEAVMVRTRSALRGYRFTHHELRHRTYLEHRCPRPCDRPLDVAWHRRACLPCGHPDSTRNPVTHIAR
jgi:hypothetical protein